MERQATIDTFLKDKHILILVTGSIAIYKILDLISILKKQNANIAVVMSDSALKFINPLCFEAMSNKAVLYSNNESFIGLDSQNHINYARWADIILVAPASVSIIAKIRYGISDNIIVSTILASSAPILIVPSANVNMIEAKQTKDNISSLEKLGFHIINPRVSLLACNVVANGAMADLYEIVFNIKKVLLKSNFWSDKHIVITGGGSIEKIDLVRYISNYSSGKQASNLALALYYLGAKVTLISSKFPLNLPIDINCVLVENSKDYLEALNKCNKDSILIMAAAISDYVVSNPCNIKLKKEVIGDNFKLELVKNIDILKEVDFKIKIGFKAETNSSYSITNARKLLEKRENGGKDCKIVILNHIDDNKIGGDNNELIVITNRNEVFIKNNDKFSISMQLAYILEQELSKEI